MQIIMPILSPPKIDTERAYSPLLTEIMGRTIIQYVLEPLLRIENAKLAVVVRKSDVDQFHFDDIVRLIVPNADVIVADGETKGSACTCLLAVDHLDQNAPLLIAGCDQLAIVDMQEILDSYQGLDGGIIYFESVHPRWSYVKLNAEGLVVQASEKRPISKHATTGQFYFSKAGYFVEAAYDMLRKNASVNGSFYVCPVYNEMILRQQKIGSYSILPEQYFNFGTHKGIEQFESSLMR